MRTLNTVPTANGQRASIALEECAIDYDVRMINLMAGEHRSSEMLQLNPVGRMPVLSIRDEVGEADRSLYGSLAIGNYAAGLSGLLRPEKDSLPDYDQWIGIIMTDLAPAFASHFYLSVLAAEPQEWGVKFYADILDHLLNVIDARLREQQYVVGDAFTLADVMLFPNATTSVARLPQGADAYPNIRGWAERIGQREGVRKGLEASS